MQIDYGGGRSRPTLDLQSDRSSIDQAGCDRSPFHRRPIRAACERANFTHGLPLGLTVSGRAYEGRGGRGAGGDPICKNALRVQRSTFINDVALVARHNVKTNPGPHLHSICRTVIVQQCSKVALASRVTYTTKRERHRTPTCGMTQTQRMRGRKQR
ncbi:hypothetical protein EVAR_82101_1 [Eumeta japonica]|uniref:Uncharacterized protein n=1 Tax=Eumeta variegata TaxID=151549 RepID=A0A4C1U1W1_EUMVA|nr:hypothetical protein EVAR_82101_1 [Eumeta japonica]